MQNPVVGRLLTQIESSKLSDKRIRDQLGQIKDIEIETWLPNLTCNNNNNSNNSDVGGRPTGRLDLPQPPQPPPPSPGAPNPFNRDYHFIHVLVRQHHHIYRRCLEMNLQYRHILMRCLLHQTLTLCLQEE